MGALIGFAITKSGSKAALSAVLGSLLVGATGDAVLEQEQRTGVFSLLPLGK